ncbi:MAG: sporulation protein YabP [Bacilli bacterium]
MFGYTSERSSGKSHDVNMQGRKTVDITGVKQVDSFDSEEFLLETVMGYMVIKGYNLQMNNLDVDQGIVSIKGKITGMTYLDEGPTQKSKGILGKLFK